MGTLYLVSTPIGNLEDISLRALHVLQEASAIAAEDTRMTRKLLSHFEIHRPLLSYRREVEEQRIPELLGRLASEDIALVTDAGTPTISDPGQRLVRAAADAGFPVVAIPGPSAVITALALAAFPTDRFLFLGFLPRRSAERRRAITTAVNEPGSLVLFEAPHRVQATLADLQVVLGDRQIAVCRELTKLHEEVFRGSLSAAIAHFATPRGEFTLVVEGTNESIVETKRRESEDYLAELRRLHAAGMSARDAIRQVMRGFRVSRRTAYGAWLRLSGSPAEAAGEDDHQGRVSGPPA